MDLKTGQIAIYGKITNRKATVADGKQFYHIEVTTESSYPSVFDIWTQDAALYADGNADLAVGKLVTAICYVNGRRVDQYRDRTTGEMKPFKYPQYKTSIRIDSIHPAKVGDGVAKSTPDSVADDIPF